MATSVTVTDCQDCGDDIGILLVCQGEGRAAKMSIPFQAQGSDPAIKGAAEIQFIIDGVAYQTGATFESQEMLGFVPYVSLPRFSALAEAMRAGNIMDVQLSGRQNSVLSHGFRRSSGRVRPKLQVG